MQQRRLRLGDILDDYCPRERRITNHAVVAMIEDEVKQTRCTTCDADHEYKQARVPVRRKKEGPLPAGELGVIAKPRTAAAVPEVEADVEADMTAEAQELLDLPAIDAPPPIETTFAAAADDAEQAAEEPALDEDGPVHRRLIRATLPRPEGQQPEWKEPDFTIRQPGGGRDGNRNGQRPGRGSRRGGRPQGNAPGQQTRFGGPRHGNNSRHGSGQPHGQGGNRGGGGGRPGHGPGHGQGQNRGPRPGGGRKRGR